LDKLPSTLFRNQYPSLSKPTVVTVNGRPIGTWTPGPWGTWGAVTMPLKAKEIAASDAELLAVESDPLTQQDRAFNSRPFTPVPKKR